MKLQTKLTLAISLLVLLVVLAVSVTYMAGVVRQEIRQVDVHAEFVARTIQNQIAQEFTTAYRSGALPTLDGAHLAGFLAGLKTSPALETLLSSANGYNDTIRDVALVDPSGVIVVDSNPLLEGQRQPYRRLMSDLMASGLMQEVRAIFGPHSIYAVSLAMQVGNHPVGTISVDVDAVLLRSDMYGEMRRLAMNAGLIVLLATALAWGLADLMLMPLGAISAQLDRLTLAAPGGSEPAADFGEVSSKIERLGRDMQDTRQIYSALQENVTQVLESLEEGLLLFDGTGQSVMASAATPRLLGLDPQAVVGRPVEELFPAADGLDRAVRLAVRQGVALDTREAERHPGARPILARLDLVRNQQSERGQMGALLTLRDAEPVYRLESELDLARRLSAVGRLTRGVAHEVKNPLNAIAIHLDLLREKAGPNANGLLPHVQIIRREIERLDRVVRIFLDFSRPIDLKLVAADLSEMAAGVAQLVQAQAQAEKLELVLRAPRPGPRVWLDRDLAEQALLNLVNNGLQAMEGRGAGKLMIEVFEQERSGLVRVRDQGEGVREEHRDKIFDLYFTTRPEGTGIGLSAAARIMQMHRGGIELEPINGGGASFLLRFPLREGGGRG